MKLPVPAFGHAFHLVGGSERLFPNRPQSPSAVRHRVPEKYRADVAQLVEQLIRNQQVSGSNPLVGSSFPRKMRTCSGALFLWGSRTCGDSLPRWPRIVLVLSDARRYKRSSERDGIWIGKAVP